MKLKKINEKLALALSENGIETPNEIQQDCFGTLKSGADAVVIMPKKGGKSTTIAYTVIQKLEKAEGESTRALIIVKDKEEVLKMVELLKKFGHYHDLRIFGAHDKGDIDYDKNQISLGVDILVGTPHKVNAMFSSAGFNMNTVKMFIVDDSDELFKLRMDAIVLRLSTSIEKTQRIFFSEFLTERVESMADKIMIEPYLFGLEEYEEDDEDETLYI